jgi:3-hydroxymyristoyl/3-hydroxydecanoyl-(acyl carrier protein) dehydratase
MGFEYQLTVPYDHPCLAGHFPGEPIVPGVILLDAVREALQSWQPQFRLTGIRQVKFLIPLLPGQALDIQLEEQEGRLRFRAHHAEALIMQGEGILESRAP